MGPKAGSLGQGQWQRNRGADTCRCLGQHADDSSSARRSQHLREVTPRPRNSPPRSPSREARRLTSGGRKRVTDHCWSVELWAAADSQTFTEHAQLSPYTGQSGSQKLCTQPHKSNVCPCVWGEAHTLTCARRKRNRWPLSELSGVIRDLFVFMLHYQSPLTITSHSQRK